MTKDLWVESRLIVLESTHSVGHLSVETALETLSPKTVVELESSVWEGGSLLPAPQEVLGEGRCWGYLGVWVITMVYRPYLFCWCVLFGLQRASQKKLDCVLTFL